MESFNAEMKLKALNAWKSIIDKVESDLKCLQSITAYPLIAAFIAGFGMNAETSFFMHNCMIGLWAGSLITWLYFVFIRFCCIPIIVRKALKEVHSIQDELNQRGIPQQEEEEPPKQ